MIFRGIVEQLPEKGRPGDMVVLMLTARGGKTIYRHYIYIRDEWHEIKLKNKEEKAQPKTGPRINTKLIENIMRDDNISLRELARRSELSPAFLSQILAGKRTDMRVSSLVKLAKGLNILGVSGVNPLIIFE